MAAYRLYFLDAKNAIHARQDFVAEDDNEARIISTLLWQACADCYQGFDLWQIARQVAREIGIPTEIPAIDGIGRELQERVLTLQETLLDSHWRAAQSPTLLAATKNLRRSLNGNGLAGVSPQDAVRYICGKTGAKMMSLQLAEGMRLLLRGSRGFARIFDEFFAVVATGHCACGVAFENAQQLVVPAIDSSPIFAGQESLDILRAQGVASCVSTPLHGRNGRIAGMFSVHRDAVWTPGDGELAQLRRIANDVATALADPLSAEARSMRAAV
jgi:GAF domain-containing protein